MTRKKETIDPICGERLRLLLAQNGVKQKTLAEKLSYTPQHVSLIIRGKRGLTLDAARKIINLFPSTRIEWLLGQDEYISNDAISEAAIKRGEEVLARLEKSENILYSYVSDILQGIGYSVPAHLSDSASIIQVNDHSGRIVGYIPQAAFSSCCEEIRDISEFLVNRHIIEAAIRNGTDIFSSEQDGGEING